MKKLLLFGKTLEYALYIAATAYMFRIICSIIIGYVFVTPEYAGPTYYYWRKAHCDIDASKTTYSYITSNSDNEYTVFKTYIENVQPKLRPDESKKAAKEIQATIDSYKEAKSASTDQAEIRSLNEKIESANEKLKALSLTADGFESLYADNKFTDSFILGPKKTYKIFRNDEDDSDYSKLVPELNFLNFRLAFIKYMKAKNPGTSKFSIINRSAIESFFNNGNPDSLKFAPVPESGDRLVRVSFDGLKPTDSFVIDASRVKPIQNFISMYKPLNEILGAMKASAEDGVPVIQFKNDQVLVDESAMKNMVEIVKLSGLDDLLGSKDDQSIRIAIEGFFDRISKIKPTEFDSHILNRIYYYYFFMNSDLASEEVLQKDEAYRLARQKSEDAQREADSISDEESKMDLKNKAKVFENKYLERRTQLIFNHLSQLIAENLGSKGYLLREDDDNRMFFFKWFAYPYVYPSSDENKKKHESIFNDVASAA